MTVEEKAQKQLEEIKAGLEGSVADKAKEAVDKMRSELEAALATKNTAAIEKAIKDNMVTINETIAGLSTWKTEKDSRDEANQKVIDESLSVLKDIRKNTTPKQGKSFGEAFAEAVAQEENFRKIQEVRKGKSHMIELKGITDMSLKTVGNMTLAGHLTGDSVASYSQRNAILPAQKVNFRDLIRTVYSDTGLYVHYKESGGEGSIGNQTEGSSKSQIDFDLTEVKTVNKYVAGFTRFSKQLTKSLPWFQTTLVTMLLREFYNQENDYFKSTVAAAATGSTTTAETDDVKQIMDYIANLADADFSPSYGLVKHASYAGLQKLAWGTGNYIGSGGVVSTPQGMTINNVPIIPVSWMNSGKILIADTDFVERVEVESLRVEFFEQDGDNVTKNLITARIECYEEINPMLGSALIYANL
jgi:hypothetical protein